ncbi:MAG: AAA family ATPase [Pseudonocardia sp.]|nr:AAA family ATPase [Pseudonocardia sp.]
MPAVTVLIGRDTERDRLRAALADAAAGAPRALAIRGDPGVGKTRLLDAAVADPEVSGVFRIIRVDGHEAESEIPYAALSLLLGPLLDGVTALPRPQATALEGALNLGPGAGDRLGVAVATLGLLAHAAEERPLLIAVDDTHSLDLPTLEALVFSVRRMRGEPIAVLLTARTRADTSPAVERWLGGLPELLVTGLDLGAARQLLGPSAPLTRATWEATAGNPLALLELPVAGASPLPVEPVRLSTRLVRAYERRLSGLPDATRRALLLVAVAGSADDAVTEALAEQGLDFGDLEPAEAADLLGRDERDDRRGGTGPRFRHPLIRSAVYHAAAPGRKRAAHRALAAVHGRRTGLGAAERRAFHLAAATPGTDEDVAAQLTAAARSAAGRNNHVTALALLERAARLSPSGPARIRRLLEAARTAQTAGNVAAATPLLDLALVETDDPALITAACHLQCGVQMWSGQPTEARDELLHLADRTRAADPPRSAAMRSQAALLSLTIGDQHLGLSAAAQAAADVQGLPAAERMPVTLVHALALALANDTAGARALLTAGEPVLAAADPLTIGQLPVVAANTYASIEEPEAARRWLEAGVRSTRSAGAVGLLPFLLTWLAAACWRDGDWATALTHAHAAVELAQETGWTTEEPQALAILALAEAGLGMETACREHAGRALRLGADTGMRIVEARAEHALGLLELGAGRPDVAVGHLSVTGEFALTHGLGSPVLLDWAGDLVEAHVRAGAPERARRALAVLEREAAAPGRPLADAAGLRCSALLLGDDEAAGPAFAQALHRHGEAAARPFEEARTRLCLGEHLRRRRHLGAAREALTAARRGFVRLGATGWVERTDAELRVAGTRPAGRRRAEAASTTGPAGPAAVGPAAGPAARRGPAPLQLTPQELQVALVVAGGATNAEAAAQLFLSPKTIEYHLSNAYRKLGIRSRAELVRAVLSASPISA